MITERIGRQDSDSTVQARWRRTLGAVDLGDSRTQFRLWAPKAKHVKLHIVEPEERLIDMEAEERGYFQVTVEGIAPKARYFFRIGKKDFPDPASLCQPEGVHGASEIIPPDFPWEDQDWRGLPLPDTIFYELHVGTFSKKGDFDGVIPYLDRLKDLGITAIELMPIGQFPGRRNWGYDGVYPFAPQFSYGDSDGLRRLVNACHRHGMAVVLDVVYNHFGPDGNYMKQYGRYFTDAYISAWGSALNFDQEQSDEVRRFFIENALHWFTEYHLDALRLDSTHTIMDFSAHTFLEELSERVHWLRSQLQRNIYLIAESAKNDVDVIRPLKDGGMGMDAQWNDDFHHALRTLLTGDQTGYYQDFGPLSALVKAYREGFYFSGQYSRHLEHSFGTNSTLIAPEHFVVYAYNHDQIGNRAFGERLNEDLSFMELKLAAGVVLLSPYLPLLFMGEEYCETAPFLYFVDFSEDDLVKNIRKGRKEEFASLIDGDDDPPDPQSEKTFQHSKINYDLSKKGQHRVMWRFYQRLIQLRKMLPALRHLSKEHMSVSEDECGHVMTVRRWLGDNHIVMFYNFHAEAVSVVLPPKDWTLCLDSSASEWSRHAKDSDAKSSDEVYGGNRSIQLPPKSFAVFERISSRKGSPDPEL